MLQEQLRRDGAVITIEQMAGNANETWNYMVLEVRFSNGVIGDIIVIRIQVKCLCLNLSCLHLAFLGPYILCPYICP